MLLTRPRFDLCLITAILVIVAIFRFMPESDFRLILAIVVGITGVAIGMYWEGRRAPNQ